MILDKDNASRSTGSSIHHGSSMKLIYGRNDSVDIIITKDKSGYPACYLDPNTSSSQKNRLRKEIPNAIKFANKNYELLMKIWLCEISDKKKELDLINLLIENNKEYKFSVSIV